MGGTLRILAAVDIHGRPQAILPALAEESPDLVLLSGDLTTAGDLEDVKEILKFFEGFPTLFVPGNMDPPELLSVERIGSAENVHGRVVSVRGISIGGVGGVNPGPFSTPIELGEDQIWGLLRGLGRVDILLSHAPPHGTTLDIPRAGGHVGSRSVRRYIEEFQPLLCVCGHIHESAGMERLGRTLAVNPGPASRGMYCSIRLREGEIAEVKVSKAGRPGFTF